MSQLSRPYQIALAAVVVLAIAWLLLVHDHHGESTASVATSGTSTAVQATAPAATAPAATAPAATAPAHPKATRPSRPAHAGVRMQTVVRGELAQHKVVLILFWSPGSSVDRAVRRELSVAARQLGRSVAVHVARAGEVGDFGTITTAVPVLSTPTILVVNPHAQISAIRGLTDAFSIDQQVHEAREL